MNFELKDFRQHVLTSLGNIFGFLLGFLGQRITEPNFALHGAGDVLTLLSCTGVLHDRPLVGLVILSGLRANPSDPRVWEGGHVLDTNNGKTFQL